MTENQMSNLSDMGLRWRTSITKILDNAIIGFCGAEKLLPPKKEVPKRIDKLTSKFESYAKYFDDHPPFNDAQLEIHRSVISQRRALGSAEHAINDDKFLEDLHDLLIKWRMGRSKLFDIKFFKGNIRKLKGEICELERFTIMESEDEFSLKVIPMVVKIILNPNRDFQINNSHAKVVVWSKTLHHLLPDLIPPIDRKHTGSFFVWYPNDFRYRQEEILEEGLSTFNEIARKVQPQISRLVCPRF